MINIIIPHKLLLILSICSYFMLSHSTIHHCHETEKKALLNFKHTIQFSNPSTLPSWLGDDCCAWDGIECDNVTGNVIELDLYQKLSYDAAINGDVLTPLLSLHYISYLDVSNNNFTGSQVPNCLGSFTSLKFLNISNTRFQGSIPDNLGNLSALQYLDFSNNDNSEGEVFINNAGWLSQLRSLRVLRLNGVDMRGASSWLEALNTLPFITEISITNCELNYLPSLSHTNFTYLTTLNLASNNIFSIMPEWLCNLKNLKHLDLRQNNFYGTIPASIGNLSLLESLFLLQNQLTGEIPTSIANLRALRYLHMSFNNFSGELLEEHFTSMSNLISLFFLANLLVFKPKSNWTPPFQLQSLALDYCELGPKFPQWIRTQESLSYLSLSNTGIIDSLPNWFLNLSQLEYLVLSNNVISGKLESFVQPKLRKLYLCNISLSYSTIQLDTTDLSNDIVSRRIPSTFCEFEGLEILDFSNNNLSGVIPNCWRSWTSLKYLKVYNNILHGEIPKSLCSLDKLRSLILGKNYLSGNFPPCLTNSMNLIVLDLSNNMLKGYIPSWPEESQSQYLSILDLSSNKFTGEIPQLSHLPYLQILDLSNNNLSGPIPSNLGRLGAMVMTSYNWENPFFMDGEGGVETFWFITKGILREYKYGSLELVKILDLSNNDLSGQIPDELMNLHELQTLNLSRNNLTGEIPININGLHKIEALDLSINHLSGEIPLSLQSLYFLEHLNLSYNNLWGKIPTGEQLQTLTDPSIYEGNPSLCGFPLKVCSDGGGNKHKDDMHDGMEEFIWLYFAIGLGFVFGLWTFLGILIVQRKWRISFFHIVDKLYEVIYQQVHKHVKV